MTAYQLYEPIFLYTCQLNRLARNGAYLSYQEARSNYEKLLAQISTYAEQDPYLREQVRHLDTPIRYFIDHLMMSPKGKLPFAAQWSRNKLGSDTEGLAGDEAFFDYYLNPTLAEPPSDSVADRLVVFYTCLGLGFEGRHFREPGELRRYMSDIRNRIGHLIPPDEPSHLSPQAYQGLDTRNLAEPPRAKPFALISAFCCLLLSGVCIYILLYERIRDAIPEAMHYIIDSHQVATEERLER